jgi:hypothetical protein
MKRTRTAGCFIRIQTISRDTYPYLMICQLKVLCAHSQLSFEPAQWGPLKEAFGEALAVLIWPPTGTPTPNLLRARAGLLWCGWWLLVAVL